MPLFLITPIQTDAHEWRSSNFLAPIQVEAKDEQEARRQASTAFWKPGSRRADVSPWLQGTLATAELVSWPPPAAPMLSAKPLRRLTDR
jgi:hypothetical protein